MTASQHSHTSIGAPRRSRVLALTCLLAAIGAGPALAQQERMYFPAVENVADVLVQRIQAETVRIDMSAWYLTEGLIVNALLQKHAQGVPIRLIGDRGSIFEIDPHTKNAFYRLADAGVPIRLRVHPTWYPEIVHWKATIFVGQNIVTFGSANYTPFELAPVSSTNYKDETVLFTDDAALVGAFKTKFDQMWNDTTVEPRSLISAPPYFMNWHDACRMESACSDFATLYPNPKPMTINTARLEPNNPLPADMGWGQGPLFNDRLVDEIGKETARVDFAIYRLTVDNVTDALLAKHKAGVPVRIIMEPNEYRNRKWPEFWLTHANMDKLWAAGVPIKQRIHDGLTHMKMLVTSSVATNASSNIAAAWQRDHNYFVPASTKPAIYGAMRTRFDTMWNDAAGFADFVPEPPDAASLSTPSHQATGISTSPTLVWNRAVFAVSYDIYLGTTSNNMVKVANVPALLVNDPPTTYSWAPATPLQSGTTYFWRVVSRTNATTVNSSLSATSSTRSFTTGGVAAPVPPSDPTPADGATGVSLSPTLSWAAQAAGTSYAVAFGTSNPPPQVASGLTTASYSPGALAQGTTYYWRVTASSSAGAAAGAVWSFTTGTTATSPPEIVLYATDVTTMVGNWSRVNDPSAAAGTMMRSLDLGYANTNNALANPSHYFEATFDAVAGTRYRVWVRMRAKDDSKWNDSVFVQFSGGVNQSGEAIYRIGTTSALTENLWTCSTCQTFNWGWSRHAYWLSDTGDVWFQNSGPQTLRIQTREDGADIDQIVISPAGYLNTAPGPVSNDTTIVPKPATNPDPTPQPPAAPSSPSPASGSTASSPLTLSWTAAGASTYDVYFGAVNPPPVVNQGQTAAWFSVDGLSAGQTYFWRIVARNATGATEGPLWSFTTPAAQSAPAEIVIYASDIPSASLHGSWAKGTDSASPASVRLETTNTKFQALDTPLASPAHYVDVTFDAQAGVPYRIWLRLKAMNNDKFNDAVWVQFSGSLANSQPLYRIGTTSGLLVNLATSANASSLNNWGWQNTAYWLNQATAVTFATSGPQTMRIQVREDGVMLDQIVLSPSAYMNTAPGLVGGDATIVPKP